MPLIPSAIIRLIRLTPITATIEEGIRRLIAVVRGAIANL
jgi:hypothetical protein